MVVCADKPRSGSRGHLLFCAIQHFLFTLFPARLTEERDTLPSGTGVSIGFSVVLTEGMKERDTLPFGTGVSIGFSVVLTEGMKERDTLPSGTLWLRTILLGAGFDWVS